MKALTLPAFRVNHALLIVAGLLLALTIWPWLPGREPASPRSGGAEATASVPMLRPLPPLAGFAATGERPLFSSTRRPVVLEKPAPVVTGLETRYRLLGVVITGRERRAMLAEGARRFELGVGGVLDGCTVARIEQSRLTLTCRAGEAVLPLRQTTGSTTPGKPTP